MTRRLIDVTPEGIADYFEYHDADDTFTVHTVADVTSTIEANKRLFNETNGYNAARDMKHVAEIPMGVVALWKNKYGVDVLNRDHLHKVKQLLDSNEWQYLRTSGGRLA